jgi:hypothetical protein
MMYLQDGSNNQGNACNSVQDLLMGHARFVCRSRLPRPGQPVGAKARPKVQDHFLRGGCCTHLGLHPTGPNNPERVNKQERDGPAAHGKLSPKPSPESGFVSCLTWENAVHRWECQQQDVEFCILPPGLAPVHLRHIPYPRRMQI